MKIVLRTVALGLAALASLTPASAQPAENRWTAHTSLREITALATSPDAIWAATMGGVFSYDVGTGEIGRYTITEGLFNTEAQAIAYDGGCDAGGCVWVGYGDGVLDRIRLSDGAVRTFRDIARAERFASREIHRLATRGDSVLVATAFGLVIFDAGKGEVRDSYDQLGTLPAGTAVYDALAAPLPDGQDGLWLAAAGGIAYAPFAAPNLKDPDAWTVEPVAAGEPRTLAYAGGRLFVGTTDALAVREAGGTYRNLDVTRFGIRALAVEGDRLYAADRFGVFVAEAGGAPRRVTTPGLDALVALTVGPQGDLWLGDEGAGLARAAAPPAGAGTLEMQPAFYPEGPYDTRFDDLEVTADGALWAGGILTADGRIVGAGFYRRGSDGDWTDYTRRTLPALGANYTRIDVDAEGNAWAASQGNGLARVTPDGEVAVFGRQNSTLRAPVGVGNLDFILVGGVGSEPDGHVWVTNRGAATSLHVRTPGGDWYGLPVRSCAGDRFSPTASTFDRIFVDSFGQKWIRVVSQTNFRQGIGLLVLDTGADPADPNDDACRFFSGGTQQGQGLPSADVYAFAEDQEGRVWIGTGGGGAEGGGLAYVINNGVVAQDPNTVPLWPQRAVTGEGVWLLPGSDVRALAVDPANRLWVGTDEEGLHVVEAQGAGFEEVERFQAAASPLISDAILDVAIEPRTGEVYISTGAGLVSYRGDAVAPAEEAGDLFVYPNPVRPDGGALPDVFIEGLVDATEVLILAPHGEVVHRFEARGGRARWDGRDRFGQAVPSGMYLVVAVGAGGESAAYGKVAVIR